MVHKVIDTAIQLHGALGFSQDTPLAKWYTQVRSQRLVDGPDEVHKWKIGKNVIKAFREHGNHRKRGGRRFVDLTTVIARGSEANHFSTLGKMTDCSSLRFLANDARWSNLFSASTACQATCGLSWRGG